MSAIRSKDTKPELFIRKSLFADGYRYRIAPSNIVGHPDIYLPKYKLAIFIHGCFWHRHAGCRYAYTPKSHMEFWQKKFSDNLKRDAEVRALLNEKKIRIIIVWECAIKVANKKHGDPQGLIRYIEERIHSDFSECEVEADESFKTWRDRYNCL